MKRISRKFGSKSLINKTFNLYHHPLFNPISHFHSSSPTHFLKLNRRQKRIERFGNYDLILPDAHALLSQNLKKSDLAVPKSISLPDYASAPDGISMGAKTLMMSGKVYFHTPKEIDGIRKASAIVKMILDRVEEVIRVGMTTLEIDELVHSLAVKNGAFPSPLGYQGFPRSCCTSVNNVLCHGIPDSRPLRSGDIINVDVTVFMDGCHGDASRTFLIGDVDSLGKKLVEDTEEALMLGISVCKDGEDLSAIGTAIESFAIERGYTVNGDCCGHGVGKYFHMPPTISHTREQPPSFGIPRTMKAGMVFTVEPILCQGRPDLVKWPDGWTLVSKDGGRSAQFEHTILVCKDGCEILTS